MLVGNVTLCMNAQSRFTYDLNVIKPTSNMESDTFIVQCWWFSVSFKVIASDQLHVIVNIQLSRCHPSNSNDIYHTIKLVSLIFLEVRKSIILYCYIIIIYIYYPMEELTLIGLTFVCLDCIGISGLKRYCCDRSI